MERYCRCNRELIFIASYQVKIFGETGATQTIFRSAKIIFNFYICEYAICILRAKMEKINKANNQESSTYKILSFLADLYLYY